MILSRHNLKKIHTPGLELPTDEMFELPEKVLQFGTGMLLRGLPDYFIDKANKNGLFNGRIAVVKSTAVGSVNDFEKQDGLYTIYTKGIENGREVNEQVICSAISRVLSASTDWATILEIAKSPQLSVIISNTTEIGIQLVNDDVCKQPPVSYPGKLLAILYERYKAFKGSDDSGLIIIPTELIADNGKKVEAIVLELAHMNQLEPAFMDWLERSNRFCNSLVDRIVPGKPDDAQKKEMENARGYSDELNIVAEPYSLWAIEGDEKVASVLSFCKADSGVVIVPDIGLFRELKLRLLNATHTLSCAVAILSGFDTVKESMDDGEFLNFISGMLFDEILPSIPYSVDLQIATDFANKVLDRFRNPYVRHEWMSISVQYSTKIKSRVIPLIVEYYKLNNSVPKRMAEGFAAFLRFMKTRKSAAGQYSGFINNREYIVTDSNAEYFSKIWERENINEVVEIALKNRDLWDTDMSALPGFLDAVATQLTYMLSHEKMHTDR